MRFIALPAVRRLEGLATAGCNPEQMVFTLRQELVELIFITTNLSSPSLSILPLYNREASPPRVQLGIFCLLATASSQGSGLRACLSVDPTDMMCAEGVRQEGILALDLEGGGAGRRERVGCPLVDVCPALY